jgi:hypothetical protein
MKSSEERRAWDMKSCDNIFTALKLNMTSANAVKFCRRVGEKGEGPRPLVVGLRREWQKEDLLESAKNLRSTQYADVVIIPDLTKEQRQEEADMHSEATRRNGELTQEDRAKNLEWMVVGARGERRIVKGTVRAGGAGAQPAQRGGGRGGPVPPPAQQGGGRGGPAPPPAPGGGGRGAGLEPQLLPACPGPDTWDPAVGVRGASAAQRGRPNQRRASTKRRRGETDPQDEEEEDEEEEMEEERQAPPQPGMN